jgi:hypothetical protein
MSKEPITCRQCDKVGERHKHTSDDYAKGEGYEIRYQEDGLDEVIARGCTFHLERMDDGHFWAGIDLPDGTHIRLTLITRSGHKHLDAYVELEHRSFGLDGVVAGCSFCGKKHQSKTPFCSDTCKAAEEIAVAHKRRAEDLEEALGHVVNTYHQRHRKNTLGQPPVEKCPVSTCSHAVAVLGWNGGLPKGEEENG